MNINIIGVGDIDYSKTKAESPESIGSVNILIVPFRMSFCRNLPKEDLQLAGTDANSP